MTTEQHWDLLGEVANGLVASKDFPIERGVLPGGTSKFSPQPTATFQVVGRHTSGASGTSWRVDLVGNFTTLASVTFANTDNTIRRKSATITWSSSDVEIDEISAIKVNTNSGSFDLRKVSIAIAQQGVIKKTVARVPLSPKLLNPSNTGAEVVAEPAIYKHVTADFSPAPTIKLRATAAASSTAEIRVELWPNGGSSKVTGSTLSFPNVGLSSKETGALTLTNNTEYVARLFVVDLVGSEIGEPIEPGLYSVELVLEQSTTDTHGLDCLVGIYTGISSAVDLNSGSDGTNLGFLIKAPEFNVPSSTTEWQWTAKRISTSGSVGVNFANVSKTPVEVGSVTPITVSTYSLFSGGIPSFPSAGQNVDSQIKVTGSSTTGKGTMSRLRSAMCLKDLILPSIYDLKITENPIFSPNGDSAKDTASFSAKIDDNFSFPVTTSFEITPATGSQPVATIPGTSVNSHLGTTTATWNGYTTGANPQVVDDGDYIVKVRATDAANNVKLSLVSVTVRVDKLKPTVSALSANNMFFSPDGQNPDDKDTTTISGTYGDLNGPLTWRLAIKNSAGNEVNWWSDSHPSVMSKTWDGKNELGQPAGEATYSAVLRVTDAAANVIDSNPLTGLVVDLTLPTISGPTRTYAAISPNNDGVKEDTLISASLFDANGLSWSMPITNGGPAVRIFSGTNTSVSEIWDGKNSANPPTVVPDATYNATLTATDPAGNARSASPLPITVDTTVPRLANFSAPSPFSPNGDNKKETTAISGSIEDASYPINWTLKITQGGNPVKTLATGTGGGVSGSWDGRNTAGNLADDGIYDVTVTASDDVGLSVTASPKSVILDKIAPTISGFGASETLFSPNNPPDGRKDDTTISATLADANGPITYSLVITDSGGSTVRSFPTASGTAVSTLWNGKNNSNVHVGDGTYAATLTATDAADIVSVSLPLSLVVDTLAPSVTNLVADPGPFSPNGDGWKETTTISAGLGEANGAPLWDLVLSGAPNLPTFSGTGTSVSALWDGKDASAGDLSSGTYTATLNARDVAGNLRSVPTQVVIDKTAPTISGLNASEMFFSPNGDGVKEKTTISASLGDLSPPLSWTVVIKQGATTVRTLPAGTGSSPSVDWNGRDDATQLLADGTYSATISVTDDQHLSTSATINSDIVVDTIFPTMVDVVASEPVFSPNGDNQKETTTVTATLADLNALSWNVAIKNSSNALIRTLLGTGAAVSAEWNGCTQVCPRQPDGSYNATVTGTDPAGNAVVSVPISIKLDTAAPTISGLTISPTAFSPNFDGVQDETVVTATVSDATMPIAWTIEIKRSGVVLQTGSGSLTASGDVAFTWDGTDDTGTFVSDAEENTIADDGTYTAVVTATDPGSNAGPATSPITLDTIVPSVVEGSLVPRDGMNLTATATSIGARVRDTGAGLAAAVEAALFDLTAGTQSPLSVTISNGVLSSPMIAPTPNHLYRVRITLHDLAGNANTTAHSVGFLPITTTSANDGRASITRTDCTIVLGSVDVGTGMQQADCPAVNISVTPGTIAYSNSVNGPGSAYAKHTVPLATATLQGQVPLVEFLPAFSADESRSVTQRFDVPDPTIGPDGGSTSSPAPITPSLPATQIALPAMPVRVPASWTRVSIGMDPVPISPAPESCVDPQPDALQPCQDPLFSRYLLVLDPSADVAAVSAQHASAHPDMVLTGTTYDVPNAYQAMVSAASLPELINIEPTRQIVLDVLTCTLPPNLQDAIVADTNNGDNQIWGDPDNPTNEIILGLDGDDDIKGFGGDDRICGGAGNDGIHGGADNDELGGGDGIDLLAGASGNDRLSGDMHPDALFGGAGDDHLIGGDDLPDPAFEAQDSYQGYVSDADYLVGGDGIDILTPGATDEPHDDALPLPTEACPELTFTKIGVYRPVRLVHQDPATPCRTITGTIKKVFNEDGSPRPNPVVKEDGDLHITLFRDGNEWGDIPGNRIELELMPRDYGHLPSVSLDDTLTVTGLYVRDRKHDHLELHPVYQVTRERGAVTESGESGPGYAGSPFTIRPGGQRIPSNVVPNNRFCAPGESCVGTRYCWTESGGKCTDWNGDTKFD